MEYGFSQLRSMFQRAYKAEGYDETVYISSAWYGRQTRGARYDFIVLKVCDDKMPGISNFLVLDQTVQNSVGTYFATPTRIFPNRLAHGRLRVSCYGDFELLMQQCNLIPYRLLEELTIPSHTQLFLWELVVLASETSNSRRMLSILSARSFWFASYVWEGMRHLRPAAIYQDAIRKRSERRPRRYDNYIKVDDILYKAKHEIGQFREEIARGKKASIGHFRFNRQADLFRLIGRRQPQTRRQPRPRTAHRGREQASMREL